MKKIKLLLLFLIGQYVISTEKEEQKKPTLEDLRQKNKIYQLIHNKYIPASNREDLIQCEVQKYFRIIKEINLEQNKLDLQSLIELIFDGVRNAHIYAYDNEKMNKHLAIYDIYHNIIMPQNPELKHKNKKKYFDLVDINHLDIVANYVKSTRYPQPVWDNLFIKLKIPRALLDVDIPKTVCVFKYNELISFLRNKAFSIKINNVNFLLSDAIEKNMLAFSYQFIDNIDVNEQYKIKDTDTTQNNKIGNELLLKKMETVYQPL